MKVDNFVVLDSVYGKFIVPMSLPGLDFFKLDVEGYEVPALNGALATIKKHRP
jgi:Methyltransferase FkbM domain